MSNSLVGHGACGLRWHQSGNDTGHCGCCHRTFTSLRAFDAHRQGGQCVDPESMKDDDGRLVFTWFPPTREGETIPVLYRWLSGRERVGS
jgi:hypothetical protein